MIPIKSTEVIFDSKNRIVSTPGFMNYFSKAEEVSKGINKMIKTLDLELNPKLENKD